MIRILTLLLITCCAATGQSSQPPDFATRILPILSRNCFACHGPDESTREADLRLDLREEATRSIEGTAPAIVPGDPAASVLVELILEPDADLRMPPEDSGHTLTASQKKDLQLWIAAGAPYAKHWSFVLPKSTTPPAGEEHPIDAFVFKRMRAASFEPSVKAGRRTLLRRLSLDLIGLPPTKEEMEAFCADEKPGAYGREVTRLLASPSFGERWAAVWLDVARYADSQGFAEDIPRTIWRYRDWVIDALNANMPFDQFTHEQMAGDLIANATESQRLATAFHRNTLTNSEGGTDDEEFRVAAVMDRAESSLGIWMGLTLGCARCHTHKYDPITHAEYYQLFDFFNHTRDTDKNDERPHLVSTTGTDGKTEVKTPILMSLADGKKRESHVLEKGNFLVKKQKVTAGVPAAFNAFPSGQKLNRAGFAHWLMDKENPLTARVTVNRFWSRLFGKGLVITEEDFGRQGAQPSHPELLDFLAVRLRDRGWDIKGLLRFIVNSKTYQQSSVVTSDHRERDPANTLLTRGARFRLPAEMVRDQALSVAGLLSEKSHGPSVFPPQPPGLWQAAFDSKSRSWKTSQGEDRHRRALYTFWRRTIPYPSMAIFDAPPRTVCALRRISTNTPLQALVTLNDPVFIEAAQGLGRRMVADGGSSRDSRLSHGFRLATGRYPTGVELKTLTAFIAESMADLQSQPDNALALATDPIGPMPEGADANELAAYTLAANVILNLDAVLNRN